MRLIFLHSFCSIYLTNNHLYPLSPSVHSTVSIMMTRLIRVAIHIRVSWDLFLLRVHSSQIIQSSSQSSINTASFFKLLVPGTEGYALFERFLQGRNRSQDLLLYTALVRLERNVRRDPKYELDEAEKAKIRDWVGVTESETVISVPEHLLAPVKAKLSDSNRFISDWFIPIKESLAKSLDGLYKEYTMGKAL